MCKRTPLILLLAVIMPLMTSCRNSPTTDGTDTGDGTAPVELTQSQQKAIDDVVAQIEATAQAFAGTIDGIDELQSVSLETETTCPALNLTWDQETGTTIDVDFPEGCTNQIYGDSPVSGSITMMLSLAQAALSLSFTDLTVDDQTSNGSLSATYTRQGTSNTLVGDLDLATTGVGSVAGTITLTIVVATGTITIAEASLAMDPEDGDALSIALDDITIRPIANVSFIPESGTVSFDVPNDAAGPATVNIVVTFDAQSPSDRTVDVSVGSADPVEYTLPGGI